MRRFGDTIDPRQRYVDRPGAYAVILEGRDLLVTEKAHPEPELQLPGGGLDPGEGTLAALHRECLEETGWRIAVQRRLAAFQRYAWIPEDRLWARKVCHVYLARPVLRLGPPRDGEHRPLWISLEVAAKRLGNAGDRHMVAALARGLNG